MRRILSCAFAITVANATVLPASAQSILETLAGMKFYHTLKDYAQRLKCFDGLFAQMPSEQTPPTSPAIEGTWTVKESKSPLDDSLQVTGQLKAISSDAVLMLRCKEKDTEVMFYRPGTILSGGIGGAIKVLVRIDDGKPIETMWTPSTNGQAVFAPSAIQFIRALPDNGKIFVRAFGFGGNAADGEFKLGSDSEVKQKIALACNWSEERTKGSSPKMSPTR